MNADTPDDSQVGLSFRVITPLKPIIYFSSTHRLTICSSGCMGECKNFELYKRNTMDFDAYVILF